MKGRVLGVLVEIVTEGIYSTEQLDLICGEGTKLLKLLGDNSTDYFKMFGTGIGRQYKEGISQLLDQPEKFKEAIKEIIDIVSQCGDSFEGQDPRDGILEKLCANYCGSNYQALANGFKIIIADLKRFLKSKKENYNVFNEVVDSYALLHYYLKEDKGEPGSEEGIDYEAHAKMISDLIGTQSSSRKFSQDLMHILEWLEKVLVHILLHLQLLQKMVLKRQIKCSI